MFSHSPLRGPWGYSKGPIGHKSGRSFNRGLAWPVQSIQFNRFKTSLVGARISSEKHWLADTLDDHVFLATLPENSLGRHYLTFMSEENLSAKGLKEVTAEVTDGLKHAGEDVQIFSDR